VHRRWIARLSVLRALLWERSFLVHVCAWGGEGEDGVGYALAGHECEMRRGVPRGCGIAAGCGGKGAVPVWYAMRVNVDDVGTIAQCGTGCGVGVCCSYGL
jgi:hypothetical protein